MSEYDPQYIVHVMKGEEQSYLVGPLSSPSEAVNWIYNQIGSLKANFPTTELEKVKWDYVIDNTGFFEKNVVDIEIKFGDYHLKVLEISNPKNVRIHPECKEYRDRPNTSEVSEEPF